MAQDLEVPTALGQLPAVTHRSQGNRLKAEEEITGIRKPAICWLCRLRGRGGLLRVWMAQKLSLKQKGDAAARNSEDSIDG